MASMELATVTVAGLVMGTPVCGSLDEEWVTHLVEVGPQKNWEQAP